MSFWTEAPLNYLPLWGTKLQGGAFDSSGIPLSPGNQAAFVVTGEATIDAAVDFAWRMAALYAELRSIPLTCVHADQAQNPNVSWQRKPVREIFTQGSYGPLESFEGDLYDPFLGAYGWLMNRYPDICRAWMSQTDVNFPFTMSLDQISARTVQQFISYRSDYGGDVSDILQMWPALQRAGLADVTATIALDERVLSDSEINAYLTDPTLDTACITPSQFQQFTPAQQVFLQKKHDYLVAAYAKANSDSGRLDPIGIAVMVGSAVISAGAAWAALAPSEAVSVAADVASTTAEAAPDVATTLAESVPDVASAGPNAGNLVSTAQSVVSKLPTVQSGFSLSSLSLPSLQQASAFAGLTGTAVKLLAGPTPSTKPSTLSNVQFSPYIGPGVQEQQKALGIVPKGSADGSVNTPASGAVLVLALAVAGLLGIVLVAHKAA